MDDLKAKKCKPCEGDIDPLTVNQSKEFLRLINKEWILSEVMFITKMLLLSTRAFLHFYLVPRPGVFVQMQPLLCSAKEF